jgi:hypothetical protein
MSPVRHLTAILAPDVVGYSHLMGMDEVATLQALKAHRRGGGCPAIAALKSVLLAPNTARDTAALSRAAAGVKGLRF